MRHVIGLDLESLEFESGIRKYEVISDYKMKCTQCWLHPWSLQGQCSLLHFKLECCRMGLPSSQCRSHQSEEVCKHIQSSKKFQMLTCDMCASTIYLIHCHLTLPCRIFSPNTASSSCNSAPRSAWVDRSWTLLATMQTRPCLTLQGIKI